MDDKMVTISVKIPKELKARLKKSHIKVSALVRSVLERKTLEEEALKLDEELRKHKKLFSKINIEDVVEGIRNDRYNSGR
jgi:post-segregation antitoxin (ccd killing protein)